MGAFIMSHLALCLNTLVPNRIISNSKNSLDLAPYFVTVTDQIHPTAGCHFQALSVPPQLIKYTWMDDRTRSLQVIEKVTQHLQWQTFQSSSFIYRSCQQRPCSCWKSPTNVTPQPLATNFLVRISSGDCFSISMLLIPQPQITVVIFALLF